MSETKRDGNFLLGCAVALTAGTVVAPLQTMNLRMQLRMDESPQASLGKGRALYKGYLWRSGRYVPRKLVDMYCGGRIQSIVQDVPGFGKSIISNIILTTLTMGFVYPIDTKIIRLVRDMDDAEKDEQKSYEESKLGASLTRMYAGALPEFGKILISHAMYFLLFSAVDKFLPSKITHAQEIILRGLLYLCADAASYPFGSVSRMQVAENLSVQDAVQKCSEEGLFFHGYTFNVAISFFLVAFSVSMTRVRAALLGTGAKPVETK